MSVKLDNLIAILRDSSKRPFLGGICSMVNCTATYCHECPFDSIVALKETVEELEVLQHAKA